MWLDNRFGVGLGLQITALELDYIRGCYCDPKRGRGSSEVENVWGLWKWSSSSTKEEKNRSAVIFLIGMLVNLI